MGQPLISLCMIVKNEAATLPRCLASAAPLVDQIIVVDTGSTDGTPDIAQAQGAMVYHFTWENDFAAARNFSLAHAQGQWILVLDADEVLQSEAQPLRDQLQARPEGTIYTLDRQEMGTQNQFSPFQIPRLWQNLPHLRYVGRFHEQLVNHSPQAPQVEHLAGVKILHYGYAPDQIQAKMRQRNIPILEAIKAAGDLSLPLLFALTDMYEATGQPEAAELCYQDLFDGIFPNLLSGEPIPAFAALPEVLVRLGQKFLDLDDIETARMISQRGLDWYPNSPPINYFAGLVLKHMGFPLAATAYFSYCLELGTTQTYDRSFPFNLDYMRYRPAYQLGLCYQELGEIAAANNAFNQALEFRPHDPAVLAHLHPIASPSGEL